MNKIAKLSTRQIYALAVQHNGPRPDAIEHPYEFQAWQRAFWHATDYARRHGFHKSTGPRGRNIPKAA